MEEEEEGYSTTDRIGSGHRVVTAAAGLLGSGLGNYEEEDVNDEDEGDEENERVRYDRAFRKLVSASSLVFLSLQKHYVETVDMANMKITRKDDFNYLPNSDLLRTSARYKDLLNTTDNFVTFDCEDPKIFSKMECFWNFIEIFCFNSGQTYASPIIKRWWQSYTHLIHQVEQKEGRTKPTQKVSEEDIWSRIKQAAVRVDIEEFTNLTRRCALEHSEFSNTLNQLSTYPSKDWKLKLPSAELRTKGPYSSHLNEIVNILSGDLNIIQRHARHWLEAFVATAVYSSPKKTIEELVELLDEVTQSPVNFPETPKYSVALRNIIEGDLSRLDERTFLIPYPYNHWFFGHLFDLIEKSSVPVGTGLRKKCLEEYCKYLAQHLRLPHITIPYLKYTSPELIPQQLEAVALSETFTERHLHSLIHLCEEYLPPAEPGSDSGSIIANLQLSMAKSLQDRCHPLNAALWYQRAGDNRQAKKILWNLLKTLVVSLRSHKEGVKTDTLLGLEIEEFEYEEFIGFLNGYTEMVNCFEEGRYEESLTFLIQALENSPRNFWTSFIQDAAFLLTDYIISPTPPEVIYSLLNFMDEFEYRMKHESDIEIDGMVEVEDEMDANVILNVRQILGEALMNSIGFYQ